MGCCSRFCKCVKKIFKCVWCILRLVLCVPLCRRCLRRLRKCCRRRRPKDPAAEDIFRLLGLKTAHVELFWEEYQKADLSVNGTISAFVFARFFDVEYTPFVDRLCGLFLPSGESFIDFKIFVATIWNYATLSDEGLRRFAFNTYDLDQGGTLDVDEIKCLFAEICGDEFAASDKAVLLIQRLDDMAKYQSVDGQVTAYIFSEFAKRNDAVLLQAFHLQSQIKARIGDADLWFDLALQRKEDHLGAADGGWKEIHAAISQILDRKEDDGFAAVERNEPQGLSREKLELMRKREEFLKRQEGASNSLTMLRAKPGEVHEYTKKFTQWRRESQDFQEQAEYFVRNRVQIAVVPSNYLQDQAFTNPQREVSKVEDKRRHNEILGLGLDLHHGIQSAAEAFEEYSRASSQPLVNRTMITSVDNPEDKQETKIFK